MRIPVPSFIQLQGLVTIRGALAGVLASSSAWSAEKIEFFYQCLSTFNRYLNDQTESEVFLNQAYLDRFPMAPFRFSLIDTSLDYSY